jgi:hypothetical protein
LFFLARAFPPILPTSQLTIAAASRASIAKFNKALSNTAPARGFGTQVIERSVAYMLGGSARLNFASDRAD